MNARPPEGNTGIRRTLEDPDPLESLPILADGTLDERLVGRLQQSLERSSRLHCYTL